MYLLLYPKGALVQLLAQSPDRLMDVWHALNHIQPEALRGVGRVYGGGLHKLEPNELAAASAETLLDAFPELVGQFAEQLILL